MPMPDHKSSSMRERDFPEDFSWFTNPLDWRPIERLMLLAALVMLAPTLFGGALAFALAFAPEYINPKVGYGLLALYATQFVVLGFYLLQARYRRALHTDYPALENTLIILFMVNVMATGLLTGTHLSNSLLTLFLGINIASALADVGKVRLAYIAGFALTAMFVVAGDIYHLWPHAPLFARSPVHINGQPASGWLAIQIITSTVLLVLLGVCVAAVRRWVERESLYREMSIIDGLTRLTNRRALLERGEKELARAQRMPTGATSGFGCIMLDLDHFKEINDTWGHHAGDEVLVTVGDILMNCARRYDEVGRFGGEEFVILLPGVTLDMALAIAERIRGKIALTDIRANDCPIPVTASLGVAVYPASGINNLNDLLKAADKALYRAKEAGRNRVEAMADAV